MARFVDLTNVRFGKVVALELVKVSDIGSHRWRWSCLCDCGIKTLAYVTNLTTGKTKSCGCSQGSKGEDHGMYKHGGAIVIATGSVTPSYKSWSKIKERCFNTNDKIYQFYGKLGITMDAEFVHDYEAFMAEVGPYPTDGIKYTIDRIDNDKGYSAGNMRWATLEQQVRNRGKFKNNTSGFTGVSFITSNGCLYASATWMEINGKQIQKSFSVKKLGLLPSFARACECRLAAIERLNQQGAGYSEKHGT